MSTTEEANTRFGHSIAENVRVLRQLEIDDVHLNEVYREALDDLTTIARVLIGQGANVKVKLPGGGVA